jgi:hypothetical protein
MHRWEDNSKIDFKEMGFMMWIGFVWLRIGVQWQALVYLLTCIQEGKFLE